MKTSSSESSERSLFGFWMAFGIIASGFLGHLGSIPWMIVQSMFSAQSMSLEQWMTTVNVWSGLSGITVTALFTAWMWRVSGRGMGTGVGAEHLERILTSTRAVTMVVLFLFGFNFIASLIGGRIHAESLTRLAPSQNIQMKVWPNLIFSLTVLPVAILAIRFHRSAIQSRGTANHPALSPITLEDWRRSVQVQHGISGEAARELESHLFELVEHFKAAGSSDEAAFRLAVARLGSPEQLGLEFHKLNPGRVWVPRILAICLGLLISNIATIATMIVGALSDGLSRMLAPMFAFLEVEPIVFIMAIQAASQAGLMVWGISHIAGKGLLSGREKWLWIPACSGLVTFLIYLRAGLVHAPGQAIVIYGVLSLSHIVLPTIMAWMASRLAARWNQEAVARVNL